MRFDTGLLFDIKNQVFISTQVVIRDFATDKNSFVNKLLELYSFLFLFYSSFKSLIKEVDYSHI